MTEEKLEKALEIKEEIKNLDRVLELLKDDNKTVGIIDEAFDFRTMPFQAGLKCICFDFLANERARLQAEFDAL